MQAIESAVIACAGLGSRLGLGMPKCMIEINKRTLLSRLIELLERHVKVIHVVVGYREELVIEHCAFHHRDVVIVRNPDFRNTNTAYSYALGARATPGKTVFLDGDLMLTSAALRTFVETARDREILLGIAPASTENAVFVETRGLPDAPVVTRFSRSVHSAFEWGNIVAGPSKMMEHANGFVFEQLEKRLPLSACIMESCEIDTPADLKLAQKFAARCDL